MCCPSTLCCCIIIIVLVVVALGVIFGWGVFGKGFKKLKHSMHVSEPLVAPSYGGFGSQASVPSYYYGRPFFG